MLTLEDLAKYPFSLEAQDYIKSRGLTVEDLSKPEYVGVLGRALERVREALGRGMVTSKLDQLDEETLSYPLAILISSLTGDKLIVGRLAEGEAKRAFKHLKEEVFDKLLHLAKHTFGWKVEKTSLNIGYRTYDFSTDWVDFLKVSLGFKSVNWKIVNRTLISGKVYLQSHELARMMAEAVRERILERASNMPNVPELPKPLAEVVEKVLRMAKEGTFKRVRPTYEIAVKSPEEAYPPCIKSLLKEVSLGKPIPHTARFTLVSFLLNLGKSVEEIIEIFRRLPDFDERKTSYHVRHIAGEIGSRTKYTPPKCESLRTFNLCVEPDDLCQRVRHPLSYYRIALRRGGLTVLRS